MGHRRNYPGAHLPGGVWALGFVSLLMDMSSEAIHSLLPVFLMGTLGASASMVGWIEGLGEATALLAKVVSGRWSDLLRRRKRFALLGYGLGMVSKPLFALAPAVGWVMGARLIDRVGKGMRGAPRDALLADITPREQRGAAYGLRQALDSAGAVAGPALAIALMAATGGDIRLVFWVAVLPAIACVVVLAAGVREPEMAHDAPSAPALSWGALPPALWRLVAVGVVFTLARFSEAFLVLRGQQLGLGAGQVPLVLVGMSAVYALSSYPAGHWSDRVDRRAMLAVALVVLVAADVTLAHAGGLGALAAGVALWGLHMGLSQGLLAAMVADASPPALRGSAFGVFNLGCGVAMLAASVIAGALWDAWGAPATFAAGAGFALLALASLAMLHRPASIASP